MIGHIIPSKEPAQTKSTGFIGRTKIRMTTTNQRKRTRFPSLSLSLSLSSLVPSTILQRSSIYAMLLLAWACTDFRCSPIGVVESFGISSSHSPRALSVPQPLSSMPVSTRSGTLFRPASTRQPQRQRQRQPHPNRQSHPSYTGTALGSLVAPGDSWGNLATLSAVAVAAQNLGHSTRIGRLLGAPVTAMALTFALASTGVLAPGGTAAARSLQTLAIQFATPWILLGAEFGNPSGAGTGTATQAPSSSSSSSSSVTPLVVGFGLAALASLVGGWVGWRLTGSALANSALGAHHGLAIAAALMAKNIGGGINYVAVCAALKASPEAIAAGLCIDNIGALVYFPISNLLASRYPDLAPEDTTEVELELEQHQLETEPSAAESSGGDTASASESESMTVTSISMAICAATSLLWMGDSIATKLLKSPSSQIPIVTLLAVLWAGVVAPRWPAGPRLPLPLSSSSPSSLPPRSFRTTCDTLGTVALYLFFTTAGAPGIKVAGSVTSALGPLAVFSVLLYAIHGGILSALYQLGHGESRFQRWRWQRRQHQQQQQTPRDSEPKSKSNSKSNQLRWRNAVLSPQRLLVASSSAIGGPPTSVALARSVGWKSLEVPALLVGNIGYAVSTFVGIAFYYCLK